MPAAPHAGKVIFARFLFDARLVFAISKSSLASSLQRHGGSLGATDNATTLPPLRLAGIVRKRTPRYQRIVIARFARRRVGDGDGLI
jgi:hypothetical protein